MVRFNNNMRRNNNRRRVTTRRKANTTNSSSMAVTKNAAALNNPLVRTRMAMTILDTVSNSTQVLSASQSPGPVGSQFTAKTLVFKASDLSPNFQDWIQQHDAYRISEIEIYALLTSDYTGSSGLKSIPVTHYCYEDLDTDPDVQTSWIRTRDRNNLSRVVLRANNPAVLVAKILPRPSFDATGTQNPGNLIGTRGAWLDSLNLGQIYTGLRAFSYCPSADTSGQSYSYTINYQLRFKVDCKAPI